jgi:hypothetical protein
LSVAEGSIVGMSITAWQPTRRHPVAAGVERLHAELDDLRETPVWSMDAAEAEATLTAVTSLVTKIAELELRVAAHADRREAGLGFGATSTATWWAVDTRQTRGTAHRKVKLAVALEGSHEPVRDAMAAGKVNLDQAQVIVDAVDALPADLIDPETIALARTRLIADAREHDAKALKILGRRILDVIAPEIGETHEARQLEAEERRAQESARFTMADDGQGRCFGRFTLPTLQGEMLKKQLMAIAAPKHQAATGGVGAGSARSSTTDGAERLSWPHRMGLAMMDWIERYPADRLPCAGGLTASAVVTMPLDTMMGGLAAASLDTGARISPGQARRLLCEAGIIPTVLGGASQVLDVGRKHRFHKQPQRIAIGLRDKHCTADGCDWPPGLCHVHHDVPWSNGGGTSVEKGRLLCPRHHAMAHDPGYATATRPGGKVTFTRRT